MDYLWTFSKPTPEWLMITPITAAVSYAKLKSMTAREICLHKLGQSLHETDHQVL
jgi:hypothetical protein